MSNVINPYGDRLIATTGTHGADIASQRLDDLDRRALKDLLDRGDSPRCVDLGCGFGWQGLRFALLGARAHLYDLLSEPALISQLRVETRLAIAYTSVDLTALTASALPEGIDLAFSQRFVHYLTHAQAVALLTLVAARMAPGTRFYLSASGIDSELGDGYAGKGAPLERRFDLLAPAMQEKHGIKEPVCLYNERDIETLMERCGFVSLEVKRSAFGNMKAIFERRA